MPKTSNASSESNSNRSVPDTATTYERAKPAEQSPGGKLTQSIAPKGESADPLQQNDAPSSPKKKEEKSRA